MMMGTVGVTTTADVSGWVGHDPSPQPLSIQPE